MSSAKETTDFDRDVLQRSHQVPVLIHFWAVWCVPCRGLTPLLEVMTRRLRDGTELVTLDSKAHADLAKANNVSALPDVRLYVNGEIVDRFVGAFPEYQIDKWLTAALRRRPPCDTPETAPAPVLPPVPELPPIPVLPPASAILPPPPPPA